MRYGAILVMILGVILSSNPAYGTQLDAEILSDSLQLEPSFKFLRVIYVDNPEGGEISKLFSDNTVKFSVNSSDTDLSELISQINNSIRDSGSSAIVTAVNLNYQAIISTQKDSATIEYNIEIIPTITNHIAIDGTLVLVDSKWRGFQIDEPIIIETIQYGNFDVNDPATVLKIALPQVYSQLKDVDVLSIPIIDASGILELPMSKWHYLFDPTAELASAPEYGYKGFLTSEYSMGECTILIGACNDREWISTILLDKEYTIRAIESRDDAVISVEGYTTLYQGTEVIGVTTERPDIIEISGGFQTSVIYGMATVGTIGATVFFWFSNRKIKNEEDTSQTGIDPARLKVQETSHSAGSYRTNRGEAYLASELPNFLQKEGSKTPV